MSRMLAALCILVGLAVAVEAAPWSSSANFASSLSGESPAIRVACGYDDFYCSAGTQRSCRGGRCACLACGGGYRHRREYMRDYEYAPRPRRQVCPPHYTVQDGVCKPYRGY
jgi:hypothetical protein